MKKSTAIIIFAITAMLFIISSGCSLSEQASNRADENTQLSQIYVYGEHALIYLEGQNEWLSEITLKNIPIDQEQQKEFISICGDKVNQGINLWQFDQGSYSLWQNELPIKANNFNSLDGYTILRNGIRKHWQFTSDPVTNALILTIEDVKVLPDGYYDIFIDVGHGGADYGAHTYQYIEAEENLKSAQQMATQLEAKGFIVKLSRYDNQLPGGQTAENNPYLTNARVDSIYDSHASYLLSNHLNGGDGRESGYQLYTSVHADNSWAKFIAQEFAAMDWPGNNSTYGLIENGMYKRWARDNYHTNRDYYFILRETGGHALTPYRYYIHNDKTADILRRGPEGILLEYLYLDNNSDMYYWYQNYPDLVNAVLSGSYQYWQLD
jgi:N-acetylmuramoyl-L-alanine amidase